jgi:hypothetical protein
MSSQEIIMFDKRMAQISQMVGLVKLIGGLLCVCAAGVGYGFVWINQTTTMIAASQKRLDSADDATKERIKDWTQWRSTVETNQATIAAVLKNQQELMSRLNDRIDRGR